MKKILFIMPLMAISLLACNNGGDEPGPTPENKFTVTFDAVDGEFPIVGKTTSLRVNPNESLVSAIRAVVSPVKNNTKFIYFTCSDGKDISYGDKVTNDITLKAKYVDSTLEDLSWSEIEHIAIAGHPNDYFSIGEEKSVTLNERDDGILKPQSFAHKVKIIDFYHDDLPGSTPEAPIKAGITFEFENLITDSNGDAATAVWDSGEYNYDYRKSVLNTFLNDTTQTDSVINMLPSSGDVKHPDLREIIKPVDKKVGVSINKDKYSFEAISFESGKYPKLFPLAHDEMTKTSGGDYVTREEGTTYEYYKHHDNDISRIKNTVDGDAIGYWLRSPCRNHTSFVWLIGDDGVPGFHPHTDVLAIAPAFCI